MLEDIYNKYKDNIITIEINDNKDIVIDKTGYYKIIFNIEFTSKIIVKSNIEVMLEEYINYNNNFKLVINENSVTECYTYISSEVEVVKTTSNYGILNVFYIDTSKNSEIKNNILLEKDGSKLNFNSLIYCDKYNKKKYDLKVSHCKQNTHSDFNNFAVLDDKSSIDINVSSFVAKGRSKSSAHQNTKSISLSKGAKANLNPILYIDEYDINGGHAASFGSVSESDIYYMMSRGISKKEAKKLLALGNLVSKLPSYMLLKITEILEGRIDDERL